MLTLLEAVKHSDIKTLDYWISERKENINQRCFQGLTPFLWAAIKSDYATLKWLVAHGADWRADYETRTAWYFVVFMHEGNSKEREAKLSYLISLGMSFDHQSFSLVCSKDWEAIKAEFTKDANYVESKDGWGNTLLHYAAAWGNEAAVIWLITQAGLSVKAKDTLDGSMPLLRAAANGHLEVVQWLLQQGGAQITETDKDGDTALLLSAGYGHLPVVQWLLQYGNAHIAERDNYGDTALLLAARNGHLPVVQWLLWHGNAYITERNNEGDTVLLLAALWGHLPMVQWLLQHGNAHIAERDNDGDTALLLAALKGHLPVVQWLLQYGNAHIAERDNDGDTALLLAALKGHLPAVQWLLQYGNAHITERNNDGYTALLMAATKGHLPVVQWLLQYDNAQMTEKNKNGSTAFLLAALGGHLPVVQWLLQSGNAQMTEKNGYGNSALLQAAKKGRLPIVQWLLQSGNAQMTERNNGGNTAFLLAAFGGHLPVVQWLLQSGNAQMTERNNGGSTAFLLAALGGHLPVVQWLLQSGNAQMTERNNGGNTALLLAAKKGQLPVVQWLLQHGNAHITERNNDGSTALLLAAYNGHLPVVQWLLQLGNAQITETDNSGFTALLLAALQRQLPVVQWLLQQDNAQINAQMTDIRVLDAMVKNDWVGIAEFLLQQANANAHQPLAVIHIIKEAVFKYEAIHIFEWLLKRNFITLEEILSHLSLAEKYSKELLVIMDLYRSFLDNHYKRLREQVLSKKITLDFLVNLKDQQDNTLLHLAIVFVPDQPLAGDVIQWLLAAKAKRYLKNHAGLYPFQLCAVVNSKDDPLTIITELLKPTPAEQLCIDNFELSELTKPLISQLAKAFFVMDDLTVGLRKQGLEETYELPGYLGIRLLFEELSVLLDHMQNADFDYDLAWQDFLKALIADYEILNQKLMQHSEESSLEPTQVTPQESDAIEQFILELQQINQYIYEKLRLSSHQDKAIETITIPEDWVELYDLSLVKSKKIKRKYEAYKEQGDHGFDNAKKSKTEEYSMPSTTLFSPPNQSLALSHAVKAMKAEDTKIETREDNSDYITLFKPN